VSSRGEGTPDFLFGGEVLGFSSEARRLAKNPQMLGLLGNLPGFAAYYISSPGTSPCEPSPSPESLAAYSKNLLRIGGALAASEFFEIFLDKWRCPHYRFPSESDFRKLIYRSK